MKMKKIKKKYIIVCAIEHGNDNIKIGQKFKFPLMNPKGLISTCIIKEYWDSELTFECTVNGDINDERISFEQRIIYDNQIEIFALPTTTSDRKLTVKGTFPSDETLEENENEEKLTFEANEIKELSYVHLKYDNYLIVIKS